MASPFQPAPTPNARLAHIETQKGSPFQLELDKEPCAGLRDALTTIYRRAKLAGKSTVAALDRKNGSQFVPKFVPICDASHLVLDVQIGPQIGESLDDIQTVALGGVKERRKAILRRSGRSQRHLLAQRATNPFAQEKAPTP